MCVDLDVENRKKVDDANVVLLDEYMTVDGSL
jgi:hypothetical protein